MSSSHPARIDGSASKTVTVDPRSLSSEANSQPMAPPPTTATEAGSSSRASTSSDVRTTVPSTSKPGTVRGTDPAASTTWSPVRSTVDPSVPATRTTRPGWSVPLPLNTVTPRPFRSPARPLCSWSTTCCLRAWLTEKSRAGAGASFGPTPKVAAPVTDRNTEAVSRNSLAGTQPRWRQVPPTLSSSTTATARPAAVA
jgi:hypothetical protein